MHVRLRYMCTGLPPSRLFSAGAPHTVKSNGFSVYPFVLAQKQPQRGEHFFTLPNFNGFCCPGLTPFLLGHQVQLNPMVFRPTLLPRPKNSPGGVNTFLHCQISMVFAVPVSAFFQWGAGYSQTQWFFGLPLCRSPKQSRRSELNIFLLCQILTVFAAPV